MRNIDHNIMKKQLLSVVSVLALLVSSSCSKNSTMSVKDLKTESDSASYAIGINLGMGYQKFLEANPEASLNKDAIIAGFTESLKSSDLSELSMPAEEANEVEETYMKKAYERMIQKRHEEETAYMEQNKSSEGVQETPSGLQVKIIAPGTGKTPSDSSFVRVNYVGKLKDGTEFDRSAEGNPALFNLRGVVPGFSEGIKMLKEGGKAELTIPSRLGYGDHGTRGIQPVSTLIFTVELVEVDPKMPERPRR